MYVLAWIVFGAVAGRITGSLLRGNRRSPRMDIGMGIAGALSGGFLMHLGAFPGRVETVSTTLSAISGAVLLAAIAAFLGRRKHYA